MLSVTSSAKNKLKNQLQAEKEGEESLIRIARSSNNPHEFGFFLDKEKEGDHVIKDNERKKLLLIGENTSPVLDNFILDYLDSGQGMNFTLMWR
jgi:Fe-S cluster assembly iron-binding protein IscA